MKESVKGGERKAKGNDELRPNIGQHTNTAKAAMFTDNHYNNNNVRTAFQLDPTIYLSQRTILCNLFTNRFHFSSVWVLKRLTLTFYRKQCILYVF